MQVKAVIFDFDGLMVESEGIAYRVWRQVVAEYGSEMSAEFYRKFIGTTPEETVVEICESLGLPISPQELQQRYWDQRTETMCVEARAVDGLVALIDDLRQRRLPVGVASNSPTSYVERVLEALQLRKKILTVIGSDQVKQGKPAPDVYLATAEALTVDPGDIVAIEDSPTGIRSAIHAGMTCYTIPNRQLADEDFSQAHQIFRSMSALHAHLRIVLKD